jgi:hypothetical protein
MGTTSLQIVAWTFVVAVEGDAERPPDERVFDQTITDQQLVEDIRQQFKSRPRNRWSGGSVMSLTSYWYEFRFTSDAITTEIYAGLLNSNSWTVTTLGWHPVTETVAGPQGSILHGRSLLIELYKQIGLPLPDWWLANRVDI